MEVSNIEVVDTNGNVHFLKLDFHHTRGDTMVYAVVDKPPKDTKEPINLNTALFTITRMVGEDLFRAIGDGHAIYGRGGRSYEDMLAFLER